MYFLAPGPRIKSVHYEFPKKVFLWNTLQRIHFKGKHFYFCLLYFSLFAFHRSCSITLQLSSSNAGASQRASPPEFQSQPGQ